MSIQETIRAALEGAGLSSRPDLYDSSIHSWRCEHPGRYGPCSCLDDLVSDLQKVLEPASPQVIFDKETLEALDPDTWLMTAERMDSAFFVLPVELPAIVIASGEHMRAALKALREA